ncbi:ATP-binding cassette domain-containing protein [Streptomyces bauhiniae]|uniref:ATP-binding cassette domain-containing protein n=1 Tax=Streptomyces bauhiniae TaxID=2340725 RepID=UPI0035E23A79
MSAIRLLWAAADRQARRDLLLAALLAGAAELCAAGLLGVAGWFLTTCAVVTAQANTTWSWMYPSGAVRTLALGRTGLRYQERLVSHRALLGAVVSLRSGQVRSAAATPARDLRSRRDGALMSRLTTDVGAVASVTSSVLTPLAGLGLTTATVVILLFVASPPAAAAELLVLAVALTAVRALHQRADRHRRTAAAARTAARTALLSARAALPELRCLDALDHARRQVGAEVDRADRADAAAAASVRTAYLVLRGLGALGQLAVLVLALGTPWRTQSAAAAIGEVLLVAAAYELIDGLPAILADLGLATDAARRLGARPAALTPPLRSDSPAGPVLTVQELPVGVGDARDRWSSTIAPGDILVITGPNGSGKTTLLNTLAGRVASAPGSVLLGGAPIGTFTASAVAGALTLVDTDDWIADSTVAANLRHADPGASDDHLRAVLDAVALADLPLTAATGSLGGFLSQGQRGRLALSRALLRAPALLLLDEPTAGLDHPTAVRVLTAVRELLPHSALVIAMPDRHLELVPHPAARTLRLGAEPGPPAERVPLAASG